VPGGILRPAGGAAAEEMRDRFALTKSIPISLFLVPFTDTFSSYAFSLDSLPNGLGEGREDGFHGKENGRTGDVSCYSSTLNILTSADYITTPIRCGGWGKEKGKAGTYLPTYLFPSSRAVPPFHDSLPFTSLDARNLGKLIFFFFSSRLNGSDEGCVQRYIYHLRLSASLPWR